MVWGAALTGSSLFQYNFVWRFYYEKELVNTVEHNSLARYNGHICFGRCYIMVFMNNFVSDTDGDEYSGSVPFF